MSERRPASERRAGSRDASEFLARDEKLAWDVPVPSRPTGLERAVAVRSRAIRGSLGGKLVVNVNDNRSPTRGATLVANGTSSATAVEPAGSG